ncbi:MAG: hypothetical protein NTX00_01030 [Candidatus Parcubacteria bacterium]|nr:hypothetical protein [Candidatus Parcubacteria bacterium]
MSWQEAKKVVKETGEKIIGRGPEVKFRNEVDELVKKQGISPEVAKKMIFSAYLGNVEKETKIKGNVDYKSKNWRLFEAALNEIFTPQQLEKFANNANDPKIFKSIPNFAVNQADYKKMESYYKANFDGQSPDYAIILDAAENAKMTEKLSSRVNKKLDPLIGYRTSLENIIMINPEIGADIGKMLLAKEQLVRHENMFKKQIRFEKNMDAFKGDSKKALVNMLWSAPTQWMVQMVKGGLDPSFRGFMRMFNATTKFLIEEASSGSKLLWSGAKVAASGLSRLNSQK